MLVELSL